jgi:hypothetical protein
MTQTKDPVALQALAPALAAGAARLEPKDAKEPAATLAHAMTQTKDPVALQALAPALAAVAARLEPKDAKEPAATLAQAMTQTRDPNALQALAAVAARLEAKDTKEVAAVLMLCMSRNLDQLPQLSKSLAEVLTRESTERRLKRLASTSSLVGLGTSPMVLSLPLTLQNPALEPPPDPLPAKMLVDVLKHPFCVGEARRVVLDELGSRYDRHFEDQWDFVRFAEEQKLGLDFSSPVQRP